ncbi:MAG: hypothetical protein WBE78_08390 [Candidatus Binataceae bacterium]
MKNTNPSLKHLELFIGEWDMALSNASFLPDPKTILHGRVVFEWVEDGAFLVMRQAERARWLIGRDETAKDYVILYSDARGVSRIYQMSFKAKVWKIWRNSPKFSQRYEGRFSPDRKTITASWEKSIDGKTWEHDFDLTYTKLRGSPDI